VLANFFWGFFGLKKRLCHFWKNFPGNFLGVKKGSLCCGVFYELGYIYNYNLLTHYENI
jgi:hypothetical protein